MLEASTEVRFTNPDASLFPSSHIERSVTLTKSQFRVIFSESVTSQSEVRNNTISLTGINNSTDVETTYLDYLIMMHCKGIRVLVLCIYHRNREQNEMYYQQYTYTVEDYLYNTFYHCYHN